VRAGHKARIVGAAAAVSALALSAITTLAATAVPAAADHPTGTVTPYDWACDAAVPEDGFTDVPAENVHEPAIDCAVAHGLAAGTTSTTYSPRSEVTRAQMATFIARLLIANGVFLADAPPDAFDDDETTVHERNINRLAAIDVVRGTGERAYSPSGAVTRAQMATYLARVYDVTRRTELPQAQNRFVDDDASPHKAAIDKAAGLRVTSGVAPAQYAPGAIVHRDQMARFLAAIQGCLRDWVRDGRHHAPQCDGYTETDGAQALQGFDIELTTDDEHYGATQGVHVDVRACNRRSTALRQTFPQKDWFLLEARYEKQVRGEPDRQWYDHRWPQTLNRSGYTERDMDPIYHRIYFPGSPPSALTWYDGPQSSPDELVVWEPGECKSLDVGAWQQSDTCCTAVDSSNFPARWTEVPHPIYRTARGWHALRLHWGGVEVGQARRYVTADSRRFHLDGPRVTVSYDKRDYAPDEPVIITVSTCNESDEPYAEYVGMPDESDVHVVQVHISKEHDQETLVLEGGERNLSWSPGECMSFDLAWDQRIEGRLRQPGEVFRLTVEWNPRSDALIQVVGDGVLSFE
jgi:hypothetical protein